MKRDSFFTLPNLMFVVRCFSFLWLSNEVLYGLVTIQATLNGNDEFYLFINFTRKPIVMTLNALAIVAILMSAIAPLMRSEQPKIKLSKVGLNLNLGLTLLFSAGFLWLLFDLIPFGSASDRTHLLALMALQSCKFGVFLGLINVFFYGLFQGISVLMRLNLKPKKPLFLLKILTLLWGFNVLYLLFLS